MARYVVTIELYDLVDVEVEAPEDAAYTEIIEAVGERFVREGYPEVQLQPNFRNLRIVRKTSGGQTALYL